MIAAAGYQQIELQPVLGVIRFPTAAHLVKGYAAMSGLQIKSAVAEALILGVTEALADYVGA
jgi:hypothetical protein